MKDVIKMRNEKHDEFDKMQLALAIKNCTFNDEMNCSLLPDNILKDCECCQLKIVCDEIDKVAEAYIKKTTKVVSEFNFD